MKTRNARPGLEKRALVVRLRKIKGQIEAIEKMVEADADSSDVLMQVVSSRRALKSFSEEVIESHLRACMENVDSPSEGRANLRSLITVLERYVAKNNFMPASHHTALGLGETLNRDQIITDLRATNRWDAIDELIANLVETGKIKPEHRDAVTGAVRKRESSMSTGIGFGIGLPHTSTDLIGEVLGAWAHKQGIDFDALDGRPVNLVILLLIPQGQFQKHLHTVANIAKLLHKADFRLALEQAPDADAILQIIRSQPTH